MPPKTNAVYVPIPINAPWAKLICPAKPDTKVQVDQFTDSSANAPKREQRYTVTPDPASADFDDDFGFNETSSFYQDAKTYNPSTGQDE